MSRTRALGIAVTVVLAAACHAEPPPDPGPRTAARFTLVPPGPEHPPPADAAARDAAVLRARYTAAAIADVVVTSDDTSVSAAFPATLPAGALAHALELARPVGVLEVRPVVACEALVAAVAAAGDPAVRALRDVWSPLHGGDRRDLGYLSAADDGSTSGRTRIAKLLPADAPVVFERRAPDPESHDRAISWRTYCVGPVALGNAEIARATPSVRDDGHPTVWIELTPSGRDAFSALTARAVGDRIALVLDGTMQTAPIIVEPITGGRFELTGAPADVAFALSGGPLAVPLALESQTRRP